MSKPDKQKSVQVTSLKSLGGASPTFPLPVSLKRKDGTEVSVLFTVKALLKTKWAALRDEFSGENSAKAPSANETEPAAEFSFAGVVQGGMSKAADLVLMFATGWDLEEEFTHENLVEMEDQLGGSLGQTLDAYDAAIFHGRLGN